MIFENEIQLDRLAGWTGWVGGIDKGLVQVEGCKQVPQNASVFNAGKRCPVCIDNKRGEGKCSRNIKR
jgi:hypothetical protein